MNEKMKATIESAVRFVAKPKAFEGITDLADYCGEALAHVNALLKVIETQQAVIDSRKFTITTNESACADELVRLRAVNEELETELSRWTDELPFEK